MSRSSRSGRQVRAWHATVLGNQAHLSLTEKHATPYNMDFYESSQTQPNAQDQERSPTSTEIHSVLETPAAGLGGQFLPLLLPHTQARAPLKPGFWKGTPGSFPCISPDTTWLQPPLCWQVPPLLQSRLVRTAWHRVEDGTTSQQISTAKQRWRKAH